MKSRQIFNNLIIVLTLSFILLLAGCEFFSDLFSDDPKSPPLITISTQPAGTTNVTAGSISGSLNVSASVTQGAALSYQWFSNTTNSNSGGTAISGATSASFTIPTTLTIGTYYYFCELTAPRAASVRSNVATITVAEEIDNESLDGTYINQSNSSYKIIIQGNSWTSLIDNVNWGQGTYTLSDNLVSGSSTHGWYDGIWIPYTDDTFSATLSEGGNSFTITVSTGWDQNFLGTYIRQ